MNNADEQAVGLDDESARALANQVMTTFANPNASTADVLEAYIGHMMLTNQTFYTASGELELHLTRAVEGLRSPSRAPTKRRFLGMPKDDT